MHKLDERGKYFTDRVNTHHMEVLVVTIKWQVHAYAHLMPGQRIKDLLNNRDEEFIALTDATITRDDSSTEQVNFVALNKSHIISLIPMTEDPEQTDQDEY